MKRLINYLRGTVTLCFSGPFPERLLNLCAQNGIDFWAVDWLDEHTVRLTTRRSTLERLNHFAQRVGCEVAEEVRGGLPDFLLRFRARYAFLTGLALSLCAVAFLSQFVLTIQVSGNERVSTAVILNQLRQLGVRTGVYGPSIDRKQVAQEALLELKDLAWMGINLHGTRLEVLVRETVPQPKRVDETGYYDVVAEADGMILHVEAELGQACAAEGDTIAAGDTLISGTVTIEPPIYSDLPVRTYQTHARGRVWARTWRTLTAVIPLEATVKEYNGEEKDLWSIYLFGKRFEIFGNSSISRPFYDKITNVYQPNLTGDTKLPVLAVRESVRYYEPAVRSVDAEAAQTLVEERLLHRVENLIGTDGEVEDLTWSARREQNLLYVTLTAQCREEIGREAPGISAGTEQTIIESGE